MGLATPRKGRLTEGPDTEEMPVDGGGITKCRAPREIRLRGPPEQGVLK